MNTIKSVTGSCLCGSVKLNMSLEEKHFDVCHCGMCRKWSGNPAMSVGAGPDLKFTGEEFISVYDSSEWAQRAFCKKCGSHVYYLFKQANYYSIPLGILNNSESFEFKLQIYVDHKPANYEFTNQTAMMTEAQVIAKFSGG